MEHITTRTVNATTTKQTTAKHLDISGDVRYAVWLLCYHFTQFTAMKSYVRGLFLWMAYNIFSVRCLFFQKMQGRPRSLECEPQQNILPRLTGCAIACMGQDFECQLFVYETDNSNCYKCKISSTNTSQWSSQSYGAVIEPSTSKWVSCR